MVRLHPTSDVNRLIDVPELVDVAHQVNVVANCVAQYADTLHLTCHGWLGTKLCLHLLKAHAHQTRASLDQVLHGMRAHQGTTGIGWHPVAMATEQCRKWLIERLALDVPQGHVNGRQRQGKNPARPGTTGSTP